MIIQFKKNNNNNKGGSGIWGLCAAINAICTAATIKNKQNAKSHM